MERISEDNRKRRKRPVKGSNFEKTYELRIYAFDRDNSWEIIVLKDEAIGTGIDSVATDLKRRYFQDETKEYEYNDEVYEFDGMEFREKGKKTKWHQVSDYGDGRIDNTRPPKKFVFNANKQPWEFFW